MRPLNELNRYRDRAGEIKIAGCHGDDTVGVFRIKENAAKGVGFLTCIAAGLDGWDHVSIRAHEKSSVIIGGNVWSDRIPTWAEMDFCARLFFKADETAMQLHVPAAEHVNCHPCVLHLWRPHSAAIPRPPKGFV